MKNIQTWVLALAYILLSLIVIPVIISVIIVKRIESLLVL